jgi:tripartite-type tricarboxylate transporter receptor subunit TctC
MKAFICSLVVAALTAAMPAAHAQDYPSKPITIIVPYAPGSGMDSMSRVIAQELSERLKQLTTNPAPTARLVPQR